MRGSSIAAALLVLSTLASAAARAEEVRATFALVIGVNQGVDPELPTLRYADDDAARYLDLFRTIGARTYLLARLDENTRRLHAQAQAEAAPPRKDEFDHAVAALAEDVRRAGEQGVPTEVFFVYAGHGNVKDGQGYVSLEDARLTGKDLSSALLETVKATRIHFIVDACHSYFRAYGRGPGGQRRPLPDGFSRSMQIAADERVGLLLSTSSARESHEWEGFQGGVFSHEVRSGLFGAADADGDGEVSYREIAAFVQRANASIPNERFRPDVWARPPHGSDRFVDLRRALQRRLEIDGAQGARYLLEDHRGVRLADFHAAQGQPLKLLRPMTSGAALYLRRLPDEREFAIAGSEEVVALAALSAQEPRVHERGAAHDSYQRLFELPFDLSVVQAFSMPAAGVELSAPVEDRSLAPTRIAAIVAYGVGAGLAGGGVVSYLLTRSERERAQASDAQRDVSARNQRIDSGNRATIALLSVAGAVVATGTVLLLWPEGGPSVVLMPGPHGAMAAMGGSF
ncbi:MAG: caspase family protein [Deltaproteobacteria bacterium]|nr:caspase family protein [Deltaproteobacteria bacterium]